jgi:hypothetical protein
MPQLSQPLASIAPGTRRPAEPLYERPHRRPPLPPPQNRVGELYSLIRFLRCGAAGPAGWLAPAHGRGLRSRCPLPAAGRARPGPPRPPARPLPPHPPPPHPAGSSPSPTTSAARWTAAPWTTPSRRTTAAATSAAARRWWAARPRTAPLTTRRRRPPLRHGPAIAASGQRALDPLSQPPLPPPSPPPGRRFTSAGAPKEGLRPARCQLICRLPVPYQHPGHQSFFSRGFGGLRSGGRPIMRQAYSIRIYCRWNKHVANPIRNHGYQGKGRTAMLVLRNHILPTILIRRTKLQCADDLALPPRWAGLGPAAGGGPLPALDRCALVKRSELAAAPSARPPPQDGGAAARPLRPARGRLLRGAVHPGGRLGGGGGLRAGRNQLGCGRPAPNRPALHPAALAAARPPPPP